MIAFAEAMWHAAARQASQLHRFSHDQRKGRALDGTAVGVADQGNASGARGLDRSQKCRMQGDGQLGAGLLLNNPDQTVGEVGPAHFDNVTCPLRGVEQQ